MSSLSSSSASGSLHDLVAVIPAAGVGRRMGGVIPKQYLRLAGRTVIEHAIQPLCDHPEVTTVVVSIGADDRYWRELSISTHPKIKLVTGGDERCQSVLNALQWLANESLSSTWVMVHDAARPCLSTNDLNRLIELAMQQQDGALLGSQVKDTIKKVTKDSNVVDETIDRSNLWRAQTPQMFPLDLLTKAMTDATAQSYIVTDEASAMELAGYSPVIVEGSENNIKVTNPEDLQLAEYYLNL